MLLKTCYIEVNAPFQLEKENTPKNVFAEVLRAFFNEDISNYTDKKDELTEKLLLLENADFH